MAVSSKWYGKALLSIMNKEIDFTADTIKVMLCTSSYTPDQDTHAYKSDVTNEVVGTGYTATGATIANCTATYDAPTNTVKLDGDDVTWTSSTITARYAIIYDASPGTDATRPLIGYVDFGADVSSTSGDFKITWDAAGIFKLTAS